MFRTGPMARVVIALKGHDRWPLSFTQGLIGHRLASGYCSRLIDSTSRGVVDDRRRLVKKALLCAEGRRKFGWGDGRRKWKILGSPPGKTRWWEKLGFFLLCYCMGSWLNFGWWVCMFFLVLYNKVSVLFFFFFNKSYEIKLKFCRKI